MTEVVRIELGSSIIEGELIAAQARSDGLEVELLRNEHPETGSFFALGNCALLVAADDEAAARELVRAFTA